MPPSGAVRSAVLVASAAAALVPAAIIGADVADRAAASASAPSAAGEKESRVELIRQVPGLGRLRVLVPRSWQTRTRTAVASATTLEFTPPAGDDFRALLTLIPAQGESPIASAALREGVERAGKRALARAVETVLEVQEMRGPEVEGFYFSLTDRDPGDSYAYLTHGEVRLGTALAAFTILQRTASAEVRRAALDLVRSATLLE